MSDVVYLQNLHEIVEGVESLAEIEKSHPVLGSQLLSFTKEVQDCCRLAYGRLSAALGKIRSLPQRSTIDEIEKVCDDLTKAPDSKWFKEISHICERLEALATGFSPQLQQQIQYTGTFPWGGAEIQAHYRLVAMFELLRRHERDLKSDLRNAVQRLQMELGPAKTTGNVEPARTQALAVQNEIDRSLDEINKVAYQLQATSLRGVAAVLTPEEKADRALRRPEAVLIISMFFVLVLFALGAFAFRFLAFYQFALVSGFSLTAVIVLLAFYLRTTGGITETNFLSLMELALLKFFVPFTRRASSSKADNRNGSEPNDTPSAEVKEAAASNSVSGPTQES